MHTIPRPARVLIIGRSPSVILEAVEILRSRGFSADATNQYDAVLSEYDTGNLDVVVFGGAVPPKTAQYLREEIARTNERITFVQGLVGIAGVIAAQVESVATAADDSVIAYDIATRTVRLTLQEPARVTVEAWWGTSFTPPEPTSTSMRVTASLRDSGAHVIQLPAEVPTAASYVTVSVGSVVRVFTVGAIPESVTRLIPTLLPPVRAVTTHASTNRTSA